MKPLISIIIPAYNAGNFLAETIESVIAQTYSNWELIIIDDGSVDETASVVNGYTNKDERIKYFFQTNQKMASARNAGIKRAKGEYIAFLDADNLFLPDKLSKHIDFMGSHPECDVSYGKINYFYGSNKAILYKNEQPEFSGDIFEKVLPQNFINVLAVMVKKELFDKFGAFQEGWYACDEHYVWINLSYHGAKFYPFQEVIGLLRLHNANDSYRADYLIRTADQFTKMLDIIESWFNPKEKIKYKKTILSLRRHWHRMRFLGRLLINPVLSWVLMPLFLYYRKTKYQLIK